MLDLRDDAHTPVTESRYGPTPEYYGWRTINFRSVTHGRGVTPQRKQKHDAAF